jgi:hypothetical protein
MTLRLSNVEAMKGPAERERKTQAKREVQSVYRVIQFCQYVITHTDGKSTPLPHTHAHTHTHTHTHTQITYKRIHHHHHRLYSPGWALASSWRFRNNFLRGEVVSLTPNSQPKGPGYPFLYGSSPLTSLAWQALPVVYATTNKRIHT